MVTLCIPTLNRYDLLPEVIDSAMKGSLKPSQILIMDNGCRLSKKDVPSNAKIVSMGANIGVPASWNYFINKCDDDIVITNDDLTFGYDTIEKLSVASRKSKSIVYFAEVSDYRWFSCFLQKKISASRMKLYDTNFFPGRWADTDFFYRMRLRGQGYEMVLGAKVEHQGRATVKAMTPEEVIAFKINEQKSLEFYTQKWGGPPGKETLTDPFRTPIC